MPEQDASLPDFNPCFDESVLKVNALIVVFNVENFTIISPGAKDVG